MTRWLALALLLAAAAGPEAAAAPGASEDSFRFAVIGHIRGDRNGELLGHLDEVLTEVGRLEPDLVFLAGDLIWGDVHGEGDSDPALIRGDWELLDGALEALGSPVHRVPGNHDVNDRTTRDVWLERYGPLPRMLRFRNARFLLLRSGFWPADDDPAKNPWQYVRGKPLDAQQLDFVRSELEHSGEEHVFILMHHMLWWDEDAPWWTEVHPLLRGTHVRAVFAGDYGPMKFSHQRRDGIDYLQTSIEGDVGLEMLQARESSRLLSAQLDNFLLVSVSGPKVRTEVRTLGAFSTGKFSPDHWRAVQRGTPPAGAGKRDGPALAGLLLAFAAGAGLCWIWRSRAARPESGEPR